MVPLKTVAYEKIKKLIINGDLTPGEFITEKMLVEQLGMSRTPIRSALERLEADGLVTQSPKKGIIIEKLTIGNAIDIYDLRSALESHVSKNLATRTLQQDEILKIRNILNEQNRFKEIQDFTNFSLKDYEFHKILAKIYANKEIIRILDQIQDKLRLIAIDVMKKQTTRINSAYNEHVTIFENILAGNIEEAEESMIIHMNNGKQILIS